MKTETKTQIVNELEKYLSQHKMSANTFAKNTSINASVISNLRSGKFTISAGGGNEVIIADKYFEIIAGTVGVKLEKSFWEVIPTPEMQRILATVCLQTKVHHLG